MRQIPLPAIGDHQADSPAYHTDQRMSADQWGIVHSRSQAAAPDRRRTLAGTDHTRPLANTLEATHRTRTAGSGHLSLGHPSRTQGMHGVPGAADSHRAVDRHQAADRHPSVGVVQDGLQKVAALRPPSRDLQITNVTARIKQTPYINSMQIYTPVGLRLTADCCWSMPAYYVCLYF